MKLEASYEFTTPRQQLWDLLLSPEALQRCIPSLEKLEPTGDGHYQATLQVSAGAVRGTYEGTVTIADQEPIDRYRLVIEGRGRPGWAKGSGLLSLRDTIEGTTIEVEGDLQVGGAIARVGQRLVGTVAKFLMDQFFENVRQQVGESAAVAGS